MSAATAAFWVCHSVCPCNAWASLPRLVSGALADRLAVMPAVVVTLDDFDVLDAARRDREALVGGHRSEPQSWSLPANRFGEPARHGWRCPGGAVVASALTIQLQI